MFDEFLIIFLREITTDLAGRYTVRVSNMSGTAEGTCDLHISGQCAVRSSAINALFFYFLSIV